MTGKDKQSNSRKRKAGAPKETGVKKRKMDTKVSKQAKTAKAASEKVKAKNQAKVGKQKNTGNKKPPAKAAKPEKKAQGNKKPPAKAAKPEKKAQGTKKIHAPAKAAEPTKKVEFVLKEGVPKDAELEGLGVSIGDKWTNLGRRLNIEEPKLQAIGKDFDSLHERGFQMLKHWKQKKGSGANYKSLSDALRHNLVERKDLAEKYCFKQQ